MSWSEVGVLRLKTFADRGGVVSIVDYTNGRESVILLLQIMGVLWGVLLGALSTKVVIRKARLGHYKIRVAAVSAVGTSAKSAVVRVVMDQ